MMKLLLLSFTVLAAIEATDGVTGPLTNHFQSWLKSNHFDQYDFVRADYGTQGSYGEKKSKREMIRKNPIIFIHGNTDSALNSTEEATGWDNSIEVFLKNGYKTAELYATSWQDNDLLNAQSRAHDCNTLTRLRKFLEAVLQYTKSKKVSIISHNMGVTIARKIIKGGQVHGADGDCDLGLPLNKRIDVLLGISGANYGLCNCEGTGAMAKTCNKLNGLWPGDSCGLNILDCGVNPLPMPCAGVNYSKFLMELNAGSMKEADKVFSMWSHADELIGYNDMVWGRATSLIPQSDDKKVYDLLTHMKTKEETAQDQFYIIANKKIPE